MEGEVVTVTVAADSSEWEQEQPHFALVYESLALQRSAAEAGEVISTPAPTDTATPAEGSHE